MDSQPQLFRFNDGAVEKELRREKGSLQSRRQRRRGYEMNKQNRPSLNPEMKEKRC